MKTLAGAVLLALVVPLAAAGQEPAEPRRPRGGQPPREEAWKLVDAYIISNLQESLELSDAQFVKLLPLVKTLQSGRRDFAQRRVRILGEMRRLLRSGQATEPGIAELMAELRALETDHPESLRRQLDAIDAVLSPVQQAKFRILELEVERRIRELMQRMRGPEDRADPRDRRQPRPQPQTEPRQPL